MKILLVLMTTLVVVGVGLYLFSGTLYAQDRLSPGSSQVFGQAESGSAQPMMENQNPPIQYLYFIVVSCPGIRPLEPVFFLLPDLNILTEPPASGDGSRRLYGPPYPGSRSRPFRPDSDDPADDWGWNDVD
jgi:hypothetical protein